MDHSSFTTAMKMNNKIVPSRERTKACFSQTPEVLSSGTAHISPGELQDPKLIIRYPVT